MKAAASRPDARAALEALRAEIADVSELWLGSLARRYQVVAAVRPFVGLKKAQILTRHRTLDVLANDYVKLELVDARAAVAKRPRVCPCGSRLSDPCRNPWNS